MIFWFNVKNESAFSRHIHSVWIGGKKRQTLVESAIRVFHDTAPRTYKGEWMCNIADSEGLEGSRGSHQPDALIGQPGD
jgi:hypothetical protein